MDEGGGDDLEMVNLESGKVAESSSNDVPASPEEKLDPVPFKTLFRFASTGDVTLMSIGIFGTFLAGATLPGINVVFGEVTDAISSPANISELVGVACRNMGILAVFGFASFFVAYYCVAKAAARIANGWRVVYLDAVLRQDAAFFDSQEQGSISMTLADGALDIQNGLSDKMAAAMQGIFQVRPRDIHTYARPVIERRTQSQWQRNSPLPPLPSSLLDLPSLSGLALSCPWWCSPPLPSSSSPPTCSPRTVQRMGYLARKPTRAPPISPLRPCQTSAR